MASTAAVLGTGTMGAPMARNHGVAFVDAPVVGTKEPAEQGELIVLASGPEEATTACEPVFDAIGKKTLRLGPAGTGTRLKLVANSWILALVDGVAETIALARALDVDPRRFLEIIEGGPVDCGYAHVKGDAILDGDLAPSFKLALARKDAALVQEAGEHAGAHLALVAAVRRQLDRALELGHGDEDWAAVYFAAAPDGY